MHRRKGYWRTLALVYLLGLPLLWMLLDAGSQLASGDEPVSEVVVHTDPRMQALLYARAHGITRQNYQSMRDRDRWEMQRVVAAQSIAPEMRAFLIALAISLGVFMLIGLVVGFLTRAWLLIGFFPLASLLINNPLNWISLRGVEPANKIFLFVGQCAVCYLFAYLSSSTERRV